MAQHQRRRRHDRGRLGVLVIRRGQLVEDRARRRHHQGRRQRVHRDVVGVKLGREAGGEPLDRGLAHAVDGAAAPAPRVRRDLRMQRGLAMRCSGSSPGRGRAWRAAPASPGGTRPAPARSNISWYRRGREVLDPGEVRDRGVVHQDVGRPRVARVGLGDQPLPVRGLGQVGRDGDRRAARGLDRRRGLADRPVQRRLAGLVVLATTATAAPSAPNRLAISAPIPRLAPVTIATFPSSRPMAHSRRPGAPANVDTAASAFGE